MPRPLAAVLGALALVLSVFVLTASPASAQSGRLFTFSGVTFDDGGTMTGSVVIDPAGHPQHLDVTVSGGNTEFFSPYEYVSDTMNPLVDGWYVWRAGFGTYLKIVFPDTSSANQGDTLALQSNSYECTNCGAVRYMTGSILAGGLVDLDGPVIMPSVAPTDPDGENGWYVGSPTVSFAVTDPDSEISDSSGCNQQIVSSDTTGTTFTCQATSAGGTSSAQVTLQRDATGPSIAPSLSPWRAELRGPIGVRVHATDSVSGVANRGCGALSTNEVGVHETTCQATDVAGNQTSKTFRYTVQYSMTRLATTGRWRTGHAVTVAMKLTDADGHAIKDSQAAALGCRVKLRQTGAQKHHSCLTYDRKSNTFSTGWTLGRGTGLSHVEVSVSYPDSSVKTTRQRGVTISRP